jgi:hypothetical protein
LDSSFYKNGKLYGYSKKKLGDSISIGFYMDGKKNGWFDLLKTDRVLISKNYFDDTLYQKNEYYRNGKFKFTFHITCIEMSLSTKDQSYFSDSTFDLTASDEGDSILVFIIKGISRNYSYRYVLKYSERDTIYPINKNNLPYFTYKLPKNTKRQYEILSAVVKQDSLIYKKIDFSFTTPLPKNCFIK